MDRRLFIILITGISLIASSPLSGQVRTASSSDKKASVSDGEHPNLERGRMVLWQEPADIERRDLFYGIGTRSGAPDPTTRFVFIRRDTTGSKEKIEVEDNQKRKWTVKFGSEARPEVTASRIVWAVGFHVDQNYFVKKAHVEGYKDGIVENVRFERDDDGYVTVDRWEWNSNPFDGTREMDGLKTVMALLNNYDLKNTNTKIVRPDKSRSGESNSLIYYVNDLGATLGSTGNWLTQLPVAGRLSAGTKGTAEDYAKHGFINRVLNGEVVFNSKRRPARITLKGVKLDNARWMGNLLSRLSDKQLEDAFRAGGFDAYEIAIYVPAIRDRIRQLTELSN